MRFLVLLSAMLIVSNCAAKPIASAPEEEIVSALAAFHEAEREGDLDGILNAYAEDFVDAEGTSKAIVAEFFGVLISQGLLAGLVVDMAAMEIRVDGDSASAGPVTYHTGFGSNTYNYDLRRELDGEWRFVSNELLN